MQCLTLLKYQSCTYPNNSCGLASAEIDFSCEEISKNNWTQEAFGFIAFVGRIVIVGVGDGSHISNVVAKKRKMNVALKGLRVLFAYKLCF